VDFGLPYAPGLAAFGINPDALILVTGGRDVDVFWAIEEGLKCDALSAIVGEVGANMDLTASRRLQLGAETSAKPVFLLRPSGNLGATVAATRWRVSAAPGDWAKPRWRADLVRHRGGKPRNWVLEWNYATRRFGVATPLVDRSVLPRAQPAELRKAV
jgi:protein ImuA